MSGSNFRSPVVTLTLGYMATAHHAQYCCHVRNSERPDCRPKKNRPMFKADYVERAHTTALIHYNAMAH